MHRAALALLALGCSDSSDAGASARARPTNELDVAWSAFATCLIGEPLEDGERASDRLSAVDLTLVVSTMRNHPRKSDDWPQQCGPLLTKVTAAAPEIEAHALRDAARRFVTLGLSNMLAKSVRGSKSNPIDELFAAAASAGVRHESTQSGTSPPGPTKAPANLEPFWDGSYTRLVRALIPDERFTLLGGAGTTSCRPSAPDKVTCRELEGRWGDRVTPIARSASATRDLFVDRTYGEVRGVFDAKREVIAAPPFGVTTFLSDDGALTDVVRDADGFELIRFDGSSSSKATRSPITASKEARGATLLGDVVVSWHPSKKKDAIAVLASSDALSTPTPPMMLGEIEGAGVDVRRRRTTTCDALFFLSQPSDFGGSRTRSFSVSLRTPSGAWSPLVTHTVDVGHAATEFESDQGNALECGPGFASLRLVANGSRMVHCDLTGCREQRHEHPYSSNDRLALRLGDEWLVVSSWAGATSLHRVASVVQYQFGDAPDVLLAVGAAYGGGKAVAFDRPSGFVHEGRAYVFFTGRGDRTRTYGVSFGEDGVATPILP